MHAEALEHWEIELYEHTKDDYNKFSRLIRKELSSVRSMLHRLCHISLRNRLEIEVDYQEMVKIHKYDAMKLYSLIKKT